MKNNWISLIFISVTVLLVAVFGFLGKPTEMGLMTVVGAVALSFLNIDKIQWFKLAGFEAKMKKAVADANATIEQLRQVAATSSEATLTTLMAGNFFDGTTLETRLKLHDQLIDNLIDIGASDAQLKSADEMWRRGVGITFHRGIRASLLCIDEKDATEVRAAADELQNLSQFEEWKAPSSGEIRKFIDDKGRMTPELDELLLDYKEYETSGKLRRRDVFVTL